MGAEVDRLAAETEEADRRAAVLRSRLLGAAQTWVGAPDDAPLPLTDRARNLLMNPPLAASPRRTPRSRRSCARFDALAGET